MISELLSDYTFQTVLKGVVILGLSAGTLGVFALLRKQSLLGDAIAHATLPGVCLAYLVTHTKSPLILLIGAGLTGWLGSLLIIFITEQTKIKRDSALGIILSVFFGFGILLISLIQRTPYASKAGLDKFLFGNASTLLREDVNLMLFLSVCVFALLFLFWKEFKIVVFDEVFARSLGLKVRFFEIALTTLIVVVIVIGLQTVGVVLMSAMLVAPAAAARQWTDKLSIMVFLAAIFGAVSGTLGAVTSSLIAKIPTGPTIVVFLSIFVIISFFLAPNRGLVWDWIRALRNRRNIQTTSMLKNMMLFSEMNTNPFHPHDIAALDAIGRGTVNKTMSDLLRRGWAVSTPEHKWALTPKGLEAAKQMTQEFERKIDESASN